MQIEMRALDSIRPYERNPRINDSAVEAVAKSIREFGWQQPIVVDSDGVIVCGHTRYRAAQLIGCTEVPVHVAVDLTPEKVRLYRIADNKVGELAEWDFELLSVELGELQVPKLDLKAFGFKPGELRTVLEGDNPFDVPSVDSAKERWVIQIECADESAQVALIERLNAEGITCRALIV